MRHARPERRRRRWRGNGERAQQKVRKCGTTEADGTKQRERKKEKQWRKKKRGQGFEKREAEPTTREQELMQA